MSTFPACAAAGYLIESYHNYQGSAIFMKSILLTHAARYPLMEVRDAVKLVYQSEFGGGHMIPDEEKCRSFLQSEYDSVLQNPRTPLLEEIGSNLYRVNLAALDAHGISAEELGTAFIQSANVHRGTMASFREKLSLLMELTTAGAMPFSIEALTDYLTIYEKAGFPPVSHSDTYRNAYFPAYRVIRREFLPQQVL